MLNIPEKVRNTLIEKYDVPGSFYTSYPSLSRWDESFHDNDYRETLLEFFSSEDNPPLSLYIHFPFCAELCYYCFCTIAVTKNRVRISKYLEYLKKELGMFADFVKANSIKLNVKEVHLGGGSPSYMERGELTELVDMLKTFIKIEDLKEFMIEIDVRNVDADKVKFYHELGFNRISMGIQDLYSDVQKAINRIQPVEMLESILTPEVKEAFGSINFDLIYGLPRQTRESFRETIATVEKFAPDRICLYCYNHRPDIHKHQALMHKSELPDIYEKNMINMESIQRLGELGYERIGIDHFAKVNDDLAVAKRNRTLTRLFNGYAPGRTHHLLGFGAASSSTYKTFYSQNYYSHDEYFKCIDEGKFPIFRGYKLDKDDVIRRDVIFRILTVSYVDIHEVETTYGITFNKYFRSAIDSMGEMISDGLVEITPSALGVTALGSFFLRNICMPFDKYCVDANFKDVIGIKN